MVDNALMQLLRERARIYRDPRWPELHTYTTRGGNNQGDYTIRWNNTCVFFERPDGNRSSFYDIKDNMTVSESIREVFFG